MPLESRADRRASTAESRTGVAAAPAEPAEPADRRVER
jgi:hypothetical protein